MAEKKSRSYDVEAMTFVLVGNVLTAEVKSEAMDALNESQHHALLVGYANICVDSTASLAKKDGFTVAQRLEKMQQTCAALNAGTYKHERASRAKVAETVSKAVGDIAHRLLDIIPKFVKGDYANITAEEANLIKAYDLDKYNDWLEQQDVDEA